MKRWLIIFTILLSLIAFSAAMAEEPTTPTDLPCPHEHTEVLCYFDNPNYSRIDDENHRVYGSAILDTVCEDCGAVIKPDVVLYEEALDDTVVDGAVRVISECDTLIIGGTSLNVYPAAGLIRYFRGKSIVIINKSPTQYDSNADLLVCQNIGEVFSEI